jgi:protein gp37
VTLYPDVLEEPLRWRKPRMVFVNSMSDLFHEQVPDAFIWQVWKTMAASEQHTFQVLTKRPERMAVLVPQLSTRNGVPLPNVWLGTSIENRAGSSAARIRCERRRRRSGSSAPNR